MWADVILHFQCPFLYIKDLKNYFIIDNEKSMELNQKFENVWTQREAEKDKKCDERGKQKGQEKSTFKRDKNIFIVHLYSSTLTINWMRVKCKWTWSHLVPLNIYWN